MAKFWVQPDKLVVVGSTKIREGLFYLKTQAESGDEIPEAIDRNLLTSEIIERFPESPARYSDLSPSQRGAYVRWLSNGRMAVDADVSMVFLFLFGLERRALFANAGERESAAVLRQLSVENARIQRIYGHDETLWLACERLGILLSLALDETLPFSFDRVVETEKNDAFTWDSLETRIDIAKSARDAKPIGAHLAANWFGFAVNQGDRVSVSNTPFEKRAFARQFAIDYPDGMLLKPRRQSAIQFDYRPANPFLPIVQCKVDIQDLFQAPSVVEELKAVSRRSASLAAPVRPAEVRDLSGRDGSNVETSPQSIGSVLSSMVGNKPSARATLRELGETWARLDDTAPRDLVTTAEIAVELAGHGLAVAPDTRFDGDLEISGHVLIFRLDDTLEPPRSEYLASALITELAAAVAHADDVVAVEERELLRRHVAESLHLQDDEKTRLQNLTEWLMAESNAGAAFDVVGNQVRTLEINAEAVGAFLVDMAWADGRIVDSERFILKRVCSLLGLDPAMIDRGRIDSEGGSETEIAELKSEVEVMVKRRDLHQRFVPTGTRFP